MLLRVDQQTSIENLRNYPAENVEKLRQLLATGAPARPDPRRSNFYELDNGSRVYYIHISPVSGRVWLLAIWRKSSTPEIEETSHVAA